MKNLNVEETINALNFGDRIDVLWFDASEATTTPDKAHYDTYVRSTGFFLGIKGKRRRHLVLAKEIINGGLAYHYNVILLEMIDLVEVIQQHALPPRQARRLRKFVNQTIGKLKSKDGWMYNERLDKKTVH
ncbi:MAG: hypothetical protein NWE81_01250 [Candidatus Bathyarchaeota archaeon]|nr:hypothetical protein [Candidatus Bathyarchaeota archaeon]